MPKDLLIFYISVVNLTSVILSNIIMELKVCMQTKMMCVYIGATYIEQIVDTINNLFASSHFIWITMVSDYIYMYICILLNSSYKDSTNKEIQFTYCCPLFNVFLISKALT